MRIYEDRIVSGNTTYEIFDSVLTGGLAVSFLSKDNVRTCAIFNFHELGFTLDKTCSKVACVNGVAKVTRTATGAQWERSDSFDPQYVFVAWGIPSAGVVQT